MADSAPIGIDKNGNLQGESSVSGAHGAPIDMHMCPLCVCVCFQVRIGGVLEITPFISTVTQNRTSAHTKMNVATVPMPVCLQPHCQYPRSPDWRPHMYQWQAEHGGSSRSHCAIILTLHQLHTESGELVTTSFTLIDLAGAERPSKTGAEFMAPSMIAWAAASGQVLSPAQTRGSEGFMINFELAEMRTEVTCTVVVDGSRTISSSALGAPARVAVVRCPHIGGPRS